MAVCIDWIARLMLPGLSYRSSAMRPAWYSSYSLTGAETGGAWPGRRETTARRTDGTDMEMARAAMAAAAQTASRARRRLAASDACSACSADVNASRLARSAEERAR